MSSEHNTRKRDLIVVACLGVAGAVIVAVTVFGVPVRSLLLYGLIALCPLSHLFMGHGSHGHETGGTGRRAGEPASLTHDEPQG